MRIRLRLFLFCIVPVLSNNVFSQEVFDSSLLHLEDVIYFESREHKLIDSNARKLNYLVEKARQLQSYEFFIDAHTDNLGSDAYNLELSIKREQSVHNHLLSCGVNDSLITSKSHGEQRPVSINYNSIGRKINRRVIVRLVSIDTYTWLMGRIVDKETREGILGTVEIHSKSFSSKVNTDTNGFYRIMAPLNKTAILDYQAKDYFFNSSICKVKPRHSTNNDSVFLTRVVLGSAFDLKSIEFIKNTNEIMPKSKLALIHLSRFMKLNSKVCVELAGHVNGHKGRSSATPSKSIDLSIARSLIILEELKNAGIDQDRIVAKGYGDSFLIYPEPKTFEEMQANMRVEAIIADCMSISQASNDTIADPKFYGNIAIKRMFNMETYEADLTYFYDRVKIEIMKQVEWLEKNMEDPSLFTYGQLHKAGAKLEDMPR